MWDIPADYTLQGVHAGFTARRPVQQWQWLYSTHYKQWLLYVAFPQDAIDRGWIRAGVCDQSSPPDLFKVIKLAQQIARGCAYLHSRDVVHADLSASNVLLCRVRATVTPGSVASLAAQDAHDSEKVCPPPSGKTKVETELPGTMTYRLPIRQYTLAPSAARKATEMEFIAKVNRCALVTPCMPATPAVNP
jgi:hypothetical protein